MKNTYLLRLATVIRLGLANIARVVWYRALMRAGYYRRRLPVGQGYGGRFFDAVASQDRTRLRAPAAMHAVDEYKHRGDRVLSGELPFFSNAWREVGFPPAWGHRGAPVHWSTIADFAAGDIKNIWESSRFHGLVILAQAYCCGHESRFLDAIEQWLNDWVQCNPTNAGPNWKCAQETGLRLMSFVLVADILERFADLRPTASAQRFVREHARRICPTMMYAIAQDNNHATSESAALFVAGAFFRMRGWTDGESESWLRVGRAHLDERAARLILPDGSFSQHSLNYHRLMLDTLSFAEIWRRRMGDESFAAVTRARLAAATDWLEAMLDPVSGDGPNLGANDGAHFLSLGLQPYRDYRPAVVLASRLFRNRETCLADSASECDWLGVVLTAGSALPIDEHPRIFPDGGYALMQIGFGKIIFRLPRYVFRPSHADALHLDLWWRGENILRDGGSYSYNAVPDPSPYFSGTVSHNTVEFDSRSQMPRIGRFLFGAWLSGAWRQGDEIGANWLEAHYQDWLGATHRRRIVIDGHKITIIDSMSGFKASSVVRWRLIPGDWALAANTCHGTKARLTVSGMPEDIRLAITEGQESRHYDEITELPVLEVLLSAPGTVTTIIELR